MSATGRTIEADVIALDEDDPKAKRKIAADAAKIAEESGLDIDAVLRVLNSVRARKRKRKRSKGDFYETPAWCIDAIAAELPLRGEPIIVDAGAGTGAISARLASINPSAEIIGIEKNAELVAKARDRGLYNVEFVTANFLQWSPQLAAPDVVIMNPPFSYALEFVLKARDLVKRGGTVCALLRLNWLAGKCRRDFLKKHTPDIHVLSKRPSFTGRGTDATEYAWFVWGPHTTGKIHIVTFDDKSRRRPSAAKKGAKGKASEATRPDLAQEGTARGSEATHSLP